MPRRKRCRRVAGLPAVGYFKPQGVPLRTLEQVCLTVDELEAVRLADGQGLYHADAAEKMGISRQTFGRILESARKKIADALVHGKALQIEGGAFRVGPSPEGQGPEPPAPSPEFGPRPGRGFGRRRRRGYGYGGGQTR